MITKAKSRGDAVQLARYLITEGANERIEVMEIEGCASENLLDAAREWELIAQGSKAEQPFYHMQVRCAPDEHLSPEQWMITADRMQIALGLEGHQRWIVFHTLHGERHMHVAWNRVHPDTLKCAHMGHDYAKRMEVARQLEQEFVIRQVPFNGRTETYKHQEAEQAKRMQLDIIEIRDRIRDAWSSSNSGQDLIIALDERGLLLANGDRRDFVVVDVDGGVHSLGKRTTGVGAREVRDRCADIDRGQLPTVEQAKGLLFAAVEELELQGQFNRQGKRDGEGESGQVEGRGGEGDQSSSDGQPGLRLPKPMDDLKRRQHHETSRLALEQGREERRAASVMKYALKEAQRRDRKPTKAELKTNPDAMAEWELRRQERAADISKAVAAMKEGHVTAREKLAEQHEASRQLMREWTHRATLMVKHWAMWLIERSQRTAELAKWAISHHRQGQHVIDGRRRRIEQDARNMLESLPPEQRAQAEADIVRRRRADERKKASYAKRSRGMVMKPDMRSETWRFDA